MVIAHGSGGSGAFLLQHRTGNGIVFCSRYLEQDEALETLLGNIEGDTLTRPTRAALQGRGPAERGIARPWSGGFMEPLEFHRLSSAPCCA